MRRDKPDSSTTRDKPILRMGIEPISSDRKSDILAIIRTERKIAVLTRLELATIRETIGYSYR